MLIRRIALNLLVIIGLSASSANAEKLIIAAAADLKFAMDEIIAGFNKSLSGD